LCPRCFKAIQSSPNGAADSGPGHDEGEFQQYLRSTVVRACAGIAGRTVIFVALFIWAASSALGAAALKGAVAADILAWISLSFLAWPFERVRLTAGVVFEGVLIALYLQREALFHISDDLESTGVSAFVFFTFLSGRAAVFLVRQSLEINDATGAGSA